MIKELLFL